MSGYRAPPATNRAAAHAAGKPPPRKMRLLSWRALRKGSLLGFATFELPAGLIIEDVAILTSNGRTWVNLPAKPQLDKEGQHRRDENGKPLYVPILRWRDRDLSDRFGEAVIALVRELHPGALDSGGIEK